KNAKSFLITISPRIYFLAENTLTREGSTVMEEMEEVAAEMPLNVQCVLLYLAQRPEEMVAQVIAVISTARMVMVGMVVLPTVVVLIEETFVTPYRNKDRTRHHRKSKFHTFYSISYHLHNDSYQRRFWNRASDKDFYKPY
ncbi:MAG TPA: hypothetical protein VEP90_28955, partial [Methylomirabilota bacterium]|nr:hypothetical protein [Methylomirabilota bacterium]